MQNRQSDKSELSSRKANLGKVILDLEGGDWEIVAKRK
jgi:hypothetical protein